MRKVTNLFRSSCFTTAARLLAAITTAVALVSTTGCDSPTAPGIDKPVYPTGLLSSQILFERAGGGQKRFFVSPGTSAGMLCFDARQILFRDTSVQFQTSVDGALYDAVQQTLAGAVGIKGDFEHSKMLTGTWEYVYLVTTDGRQEEITNTSLRAELLALESVFNAKVGGK
jgi:hypothetical protein